MNNEGFRTLVKSGNLGGKKSSTKEIARNAVEQEFNEKRRHKGGGYMDSSDEEDSSTGRRKGGKSYEKIDDPDGAIKRRKSGSDRGYRDRARERREGVTNKDYDGAVETGTSKNIDEEMSKFLGGDESHTHLVKGLDVSLADKVRREIHAKASAKATNEPQSLQVSALIPPHYNQLTIDQATTIINRAHTSLSESVGTKHLVRYFKTRFSENFKSSIRLGFQPSSQASANGQQIQRSSFSFSTASNFYDRSTVWEVPMENTISKIQYEHLHGNEPPQLTPLDCSFVERLKSTFSNPNVSFVSFY